MRVNNPFFLVFAFFVIISTRLNAQDIRLKMDFPELDIYTQVIGVLNSTDGLGLDINQKDRLMEWNARFVSDLTDVSESDKTEGEKESEFIDLKYQRTEFLQKLLGKEIFNKYSNRIQYLIDPLEPKLGLASLAFESHS